MRPSEDFSSETLQTRKEWHDIFKVLKEKKFAAKNTLSGQDIIQYIRRDKEFPTQTEAKGVHDH